MIVIISALKIYCRNTNKYNQEVVKLKDFINIEIYILHDAY